MATIRRHGQNLICISGNSLAVYTDGSTDRQVYKCERTIHQSEDKSTDTDGSDRILASSFSPSGKYFAVCDDWKQLSVWQTDTSTWTKLSTRGLVRRCTALTFTASEDTILVADKSGDVYRFSTSSTEEAEELMLGHLSMLLDIVTCDNDKFVVTSDRDEKIRVTCYPNTYNIHAFCLGHTDFVSRLCYLREDNILLSGSGDGTLRLWNFHSGEQLAMADCTQVIQKNRNGDSVQSMEVDDAPSEQDAKGNGDEGEPLSTASAAVSVKCMALHQQARIAAVSFESCSDVLIYKICGSAGAWSLGHLQTLSLPAAPWDLTLDSEGHLWVLLPHEAEPLVLYALEEEKFTKATESDVLKLAKVVNLEWDFFKGSLAVDSPFAVLSKSNKKHDNVKEYQEKKRQRIEEQSKRKSNKPDEEAKKAKLEN